LNLAAFSSPSAEPPRNDRKKIEQKAEGKKVKESFFVRFPLLFLFFSFFHFELG